MNPEVGGGVLNDLGTYTMTFADFAFMGEKPLKISAVGFKADSGVDLNGSITLLYSGRRIAQTWVSGSKMYRYIYSFSIFYSFHCSRI